MGAAYATRLELSADRLEAVRQLSWSWAWQGARCPSRSFQEGSFAGPDQRVTAISFDLDERSGFRIRRSVPEGRVEWRTTIEALCFRGRMQLAIEVERQNPEGNGVETGPPDVVLTVIKQGAADGRHLLQLRPLEVSGPDQVDELVEGLLLDPGRRLPVVVFTRTASGELPVEIAGLPVLLAGCAHVAVLASHSDSFALTDLVGKPMSAWDGAMRLFRPGFSLSDDPFSHPRTLRNRLNRYSLEWLRRTVIREQAQQPVLIAELAPILVRVRELREKEQLERDLQAARTELEQVSALQREVDRLRGLNRELAAEVEERQALVEARERELEQLRNKLQEAQAKVRSYFGVPQLTEQLPEPESFEEALIAAEENFATTLQITERAERGALRMNSADNVPQKLWRALQAMHEVASLWQADQLERGLVAAFRERGFNLTQVSESALGEHRREYAMRYRGEEQLLRDHIHLSRGERIYFLSDRETRSFVIGHIGKHLPDSTTG